MKNLLFIFFTFITFSNICYASFPVTENQPTEIVKLMKSDADELQRNGWPNTYSWISFGLFLLASIFLLMMSIGMITFSISGPTIANYISLAILSATAAIILGIISFFKK